ncbi:MAG TPA: 5-(carboxyamino)imidazole ribonucleotide mutase [Candidatus Paceibacterota bacterium]|nr:5-(carboxyamino)imidazole ribonucleotide mutase [Candidatus Paceibacterota bacterium]
MNEATVAIVMGSDSDWPIMEEATKVFDSFGITYSVQVISAHRMPLETVEFAQSAQAQGIKIIIAAAGGAAALPGVIAALTPLPVIGVPIALKSFDGMDSLLSIVQMPAGIPVATVSVGGAKNAAILATRILGIGDAAISALVSKAMVEIHDEAKAKGENLQARRNQRTGF